MSADCSQQWLDVSVFSNLWKDFNDDNKIECKAFHEVDTIIVLSSLYFLTI